FLVPIPASDSASFAEVLSRFPANWKASKVKSHSPRQILQDSRNHIPISFKLDGIKSKDAFSSPVSSRFEEILSKFYAKWKESEVKSPISSSDSSRFAEILSKFPANRKELEVKSPISSPVSSRFAEILSEFPANLKELEVKSPISSPVSPRFAENLPKFPTNEEESAGKNRLPIRFREVFKTSSHIFAQNQKKNHQGRATHRKTPQHCPTIPGKSPAKRKKEELKLGRLRAQRLNLWEGEGGPIKDHLLKSIRGRPLVLFFFLLFLKGVGMSSIGSVRPGGWLIGRGNGELGGARWGRKLGAVRCGGATELRTCRRCKRQFDPSLNHAAACRFHTAHFGGETKRKFESVHTGGTLTTPGSGKVLQYWHCCGSEDPSDPGCTRGPHLSYDDD
ncbi:uncharacterized protein LOC144709073, partial [Wolffia australiana]